MPIYCQCIDISTLHRCIPLYQYLSLTPIHFTVSISRHINSPPSRKRSASTQSLPSGHRETQPFVSVIQRSADDSSNSRENTPLPTLNQIPAPSTHFPICSLLACNPLPPPPLYPFRPEIPAREVCAACRRTLQEGC